MCKISKSFQVKQRSEIKDYGSYRPGILYGSFTEEDIELIFAYCQKCDYSAIVVMICLMTAKKRIGRQLKSEPIIFDANCTKICVYMSIVLLASSLIYELTGFIYADVIGTAGLIYFLVSEGKESFEKAKGKNCSCDHGKD